MIKKDKYQELREWFADDSSTQGELGEQWRLVQRLLTDRDRLFKENKKLRDEVSFYRSVHVDEEPKIR